MPVIPSSRYDWAIVGAGPAGSLLAYELARTGRKVLLLEKRRLPRYKTCGGGLTRRARALIPFDIEALVEDRAQTTKLRVDYRTAFVYTDHTAPVHLVMRDRFDHFLVRQAAAAGAAVQEGTRFLALEGSPGDLCLQTSNGTFRSRHVVGADGVHSRVARALRLPVAYRVMPALEAEMAAGPAVLRRFAGTVHFDFGIVAGGYAWLFPKQKGISAGILARRRPARPLKPLLMAYLARNGLRDQVDLCSLRLHPIPCRPDRRNRYAEARGLLVGDATGLVDPVTGEGIFYALQSAQIAARVITCRQNRCTVPEAYTRAIKAEIEAEVLKADILARILYGCPPLSNWVLARCGPKIGGKHLAVYQGEMTYRQLFRYVMSPRGLGYLLRPQPHPRR